MRNGVIISGLLHLAIVLLAAFGLPELVQDPPAAKPIPVELVVMKKPPAPKPPRPATPRTVRPAPKPPEAVPKPPKAAPAKPPQTAALPPIPRRQPAARARSKTGPTPPPRKRRKRSRPKKPPKEILAGAWIFQSVVTKETGRCGNARHSAILLIRHGASGDHFLGAGRATIKWAKCPIESYRFELVLRLSGNLIVQMDGRGETEIGRIQDRLMYLQNRVGVIEVWRRRKDG